MPPFRRPKEAVISTAKVTSWTYSEDFVPEDPVALAARGRGSELGVPAVAQSVGALLQLLAATIGARAVVEIGTGAGVSALWLLRGMAHDGVLTTIDVDADHQRAAREAFADEGIRSQRVRIISGRALDVLPRLTDHVYDMVIADGDPAELPEYLDHAIRLLRVGGQLVVPHALWHDHVGDPTRRDPATVTMRDAGKRLRADKRLITVLLPVGDGVLLATKTASDVNASA